MFNLFKKKEEKGAIRDFKTIFEKMSSLKDADLEEPAEDMSEDALKWYEEFTIEAYEKLTKSGQFDQKTKRQMMFNSLEDYYAVKRRAGSLYTFIYEPQSEDLQYWDRFPLVMRMLDNSDSTESFLGMNLHYLEPKYRRLLLLSLMSKLDGDIDNPESRIVGLGMRRLMIPANKYGRVCIRRYKYDNIRGKALRIPPEHWIKAIYLPTYQFIGGKPNKVWKDSYRKIRRLGINP